MGVLTGHAAASVDAAVVSQVVSGWGRTSPTRAAVRTVRDRAELAALLTTLDDRGVLARGLGRSYGDAAQNAGGHLVRIGDQRIGAITAEGAVRVGAGASLKSIAAAVLPQGWFLPVSPGTQHVTVGGAIGCDVHGKNHPAAGAFSAHVLSLEFIDGRGHCREVGPDVDPESFWATVGGMGLTGVILSAVLRLHPVSSAWLHTTEARAANLDEAAAMLSRDDRDQPYAAAWIDTLATGARAGRAIVSTGGHARPEDVPAAARHAPLAMASGRALPVPRWVPGGLLSLPTALAFNEAWFRRAPVHRARVLPLGSFLFPLDGLADWNRLYGARGLVQYQAVVPDVESVRWLLERMAGARVPSFLAVLKRLGAAGSAPLSFPRPGWTLALDMPAAHPGLAPLLDQFDEHVAAAGGAVYLAKDSRLRPDVLAAMYPRLADWRRVRDQLDPEHIFQSDLGRRLGLAPQAARRTGDRA